MLGGIYFGQAYLGQVYPAAPRMVFAMMVLTSLDTSLQVGTVDVRLPVNSD